MKVKLLILAGVLLWLSGCAIQQDIANLENRVNTLERRNRELQQVSDNLQGQLKEQLASLGQSSQSTEKQLRTQYAGMNVAIDTVQQDLRLLSGRIEEIEYQLGQKLGDYSETGKKQQERIDEVALAVAKVDQRLNRVEQYLNLNSKAEPAAVAQPGDNSGQASPAGELYATAKKAFDQGKWADARKQFQLLLKSYPTSENADNAQFWIGETYYRENWFEKAILEYQTVIEKYPKGNKVPAAMLKQGLAFLKLGDKSNARLVLTELKKKYPKSNEAGIADKKLKEF